MRINYLELNNIGVFEKLNIEFEKSENNDKAEIHIFTGINGSGKSTILYALAGIFNPEFVKKRFRFKDNRSYIDVNLDNRTYKILYEKSANSITFPGQRKGNKIEVRATITFRARFPIEDYQKYLKNSYDDIKNTEFEFAVFAYSGSRTLSSTNIDAIKEIEKHPLEESLSFYNSVNSQILIQWIANTKAKIAFALQEGKNGVAQTYKNSISRIENAIKEIVGYEVLFTFNYEPLAVGIKINNEELEFDVLPDGLKSVISWIADLLSRLERMKWKDKCNILDRNFILLLDEIEIHLHPSWQRKILPVIQKLFKNAQIFIATHSPFVVASVSEAWIYKLSVLNGKTQLTEKTKSKAGICYPLVLDEIFGIYEHFDIETENEFKLFYELKNKLLTGNDRNSDNFLNIARKLSEKSIEVKDIIGRELRQLERITGKEINL